MPWTRTSTRNQFSVLINELIKFHELRHKEKNHHIFLSIRDLCLKLNEVIFKKELSHDDNVGIASCSTGLFTQILLVSSANTALISGTERVNVNMMSFGNLISQLNSFMKECKEDVKTAEIGNKSEKKNQGENNGSMKEEVVDEPINKLTNKVKELGAVIKVLNSLRQNQKILENQQSVKANLVVDNQQQESRDQLIIRIQFLGVLIERPMTMKSFFKHVATHRPKTMATGGVFTITAGAYTGLTLLSNLFGIILDDLFQAKKTGIDHRFAFALLLFFVGLVFVTCACGAEAKRPECLRRKESQRDIDVINETSSLLKVTTMN